MNWDLFIDQLGEWFDARGLLAAGGRWVVGVSAGPDSTLLLHALHDVSERRELSWALHAAHLHHGLRGADADADADFAAGLAERLGLPFHRQDVDILAAVAKQGGSTEEVARQHRYEFLERVALKMGSDCVAVGHHADDNAETVLHRICRGTGLRGLAGMADVRPIQPGSRVRLIRPLLEHRRGDIEALCAERGIEFRTDASNEGLEFTRGRIRNSVMPLLREALNPNVTDALLRLAEQARRLGTYLEDAAARTFESLVVSETPGRVVLNTSALLGKQRVIQAEVVRRAVSQVLRGEQDLSFVHVEAVLKLAHGRSSGKEVHLPGPVVVRKSYERLEFGPMAEEEPVAELHPVYVNCPGQTPLPALAAGLTAELRDVGAEKIEELRAAAHPYEEWVDYDRLKPPLVVRGRQVGDRFWPLGAPGSKRLSDFLIDEKVDAALRARTGILCDQEGPVWVMPLRIDERVKLRATSRRALHLVLAPTAAPQAEAP